MTSPKELGQGMERALFALFVDQVKEVCVAAHGAAWVDGFEDALEEAVAAVLTQGFPRKLGPLKFEVGIAMAGRLQGFRLLLGGWVMVENQLVEDPSPSMLLDAGDHVVVLSLRRTSRR